MRTKNPTSKTILWSVLAGLVIGLVGCGGGEPTDASTDGANPPPTYVSCSDTGADGSLKAINNGKLCAPSTCETRVDQSTGIAWQYAYGPSSCNNGLCMGSEVTMCGSGQDNPCVGGGDAGEAAHCSGSN